MFSPASSELKKTASEKKVSMKVDDPPRRLSIKYTKQILFGIVSFLLSMILLLTLNYILVNLHYKYCVPKRFDEIIQYVFTMGSPACSQLQDFQLSILKAYTTIIKALSLVFVKFIKF